MINEFEFVNNATLLPSEWQEAKASLSLEPVRELYLACSKCGPLLKAHRLKETQSCIQRLC